jgi:hypothetical protein
MFHITIGSAPTTNLSLDPDLKMLKAALLYGDRVRFCSSTYSLLSQFEKVIALSPEQRLDFHERIIPNSRIPEPYRTVALERIRDWKRTLKDPNIDENSRLKTLEEIESGWAFFLEQSPLVPQLEGLNRLDRAVEEGLLEIHNFKTIQEANIMNRGFYGASAASKLENEFVDLVGEAVRNGDTYPMFDASAGGYIRKLLDDGLLVASDPRMHQARQSQLAANLLGRLPEFEEASINEILDIRRELERPLVRFRAAINGYAEKIKTASWDENFSTEAENVFHKEIEPAVLDLEDAVKSNPSLLSLATRNVANASALGTSAFSFFISHLALLPTVTGLALAASIGVGTASYDAYKKWKEQEQKIGQHQLYFYYRAGEFLSDRTYEYR